ncbi:MAG: hypothetical protein KA175_01930 [Flavobacteriales bacterium]|nr:hypothetical protein [Flavobacteriales bacterium]MBP6696347.1 hypothetical protein [Flavobacteriales bacterium]
MHESSTFRHAMVTFLLSAPLTVLGQWSAGVMGGAGLDHGWTGPSHWIGGLVERRLSDSSSFVLRLSGQWYDPIDRVYTELRPNSDGSVGMEIVQAETIRRYGLALEVKMPVLSAPCEGGYHRGAYVVAGLGWEHAQRHVRGIAVENAVGTEAAVLSEATERIDRWMGRAALGLQYGTRWGSPFVEGGITLASDPYAGEQHWLFPGQIGVQVGYRYSFSKR